MQLSFQCSPLRAERPRTEERRAIENLVSTPVGHDTSDLGRLDVCRLAVATLGQRLGQISTQQLLLLFGPIIANMPTGPSYPFGAD